MSAGRGIIRVGMMMGPTAPQQLGLSLSPYQEVVRHQCSNTWAVGLWDTLCAQVDPFFVPTTEEELEEYGTEAGGPANLARRLIDAVRRRKGLPVEEKVVAKATKQRTLKRNV